MDLLAIAIVQTFQPTKVTNIHIASPKAKMAVLDKVTRFQPGRS